MDLSELAIGPITSLPDEPFFDVVAAFLRNVDSIYFNDQGLDETTAIAIRSDLSKRLTKSRGWKRMSKSVSDSIELHIGPAIGVFFFNDHGLIQPTSCYLLQRGVNRVGSFLPVLAGMVASGPSLFIAIITLNLLEVAPNPTHLRFLVGAASNWLEAFPNNDVFWVDYDIARRVCDLIVSIQSQDSRVMDSEESLRNDVARLLSAFINLGIAEATRLEQALAARPSCG